MTDDSDTGNTDDDARADPFETSVEPPDGDGDGDAGDSAGGDETADDPVASGDGSKTPRVGAGTDIGHMLGGDEEGPRVRRPGEREGDGDDDVAASDAGDREGPLSDVASEVERRGQRTDANPEDELFDEQSVQEIDREELWRQVAGESTAEQTTEEPPPPEDAPRETPDGRVERIVSKKKYCQGCEYFSPPPDVRCTHDGTDIDELVDMEHFRVFDCPIVAEDEKLEDY